jgi:tetratricopeptide (TPR) repeat protein
MARPFRCGVLLAGLVAVALSCGTASGQDTEDPRDGELHRDTQPLSVDIAAAAARVGEARGAFVSSLRQLVEGLPGTYGDEGPRLRAAASGMRASLARWDEAITRYGHALNVVNADANAQVALGSAYLDRGQVSQAVDQFRRAVALAPQWGEALLLLSLASEAQGKNDESARALDKAWRAAPGSPAVGYARVQQAVARGDEAAISQALRAFGERHEGPAHLPSARSIPFVRLGLLRETAGAAPVFVPASYSDAFRRLGARRYDEAVAAIEQAVARDPLAEAGSTIDERVRSGTELRDGQMPRAIARLEQAITREPGSSELRRMLALAYASDDRHAAAIGQLTNAIQSAPQDERPRLLLAEVLAAAGKAGEAERVLTDAIATLPDAAQPVYRLARLYQSQSRVPEALAAFREASGRAMLVGRDSLYETIAALEVGEGAFADAVVDYRREIGVNPNNAAAHRRLADLYAQDGRLAESLAELAAALLIDPGDADAHASRAQTLLRLSRFADAEAAARRAVSLNPQHEPARYALGTALLRTGRTEEGLSALQEFERMQAATRARTDAAWQVTLLKEQALQRAGAEDYRGAAELLRRAGAYAPEDGSIRLAAGALLVKAGQNEEAIAVLNDALARGALEAHRYLADAYAALGRDNESRTYRSAYDAMKAAQSRRGVKAQ